MRDIGRQPCLVAEGVIFGKTMRRGRRHRVVNERHQRQRLHHGEIDADLLRRAELLQHQHVGVGQQQVKALDHQDRQRDRQPAAEIVGLRSGLDMAAEAAVQHHHLSDHGDPHRGGAGEHRDGGAEIEAERERTGGQSDDQRLADDELRHQSEPHPVMRARDAVLGVGDHEGRQRQAADVKRNDFVRAEPRRQRFHHTGQQRRDHGRDRESHPAAAGEKAAQQRVLALGAIFRDDFLRRGRDAEIHHAAEQQHPGPDIDIDAVIRTAHPAREQDLRKIGQRSADDADDENRAGQPPGQRGFAGAAKPATQHRAQPRDHAGRRGGCGLRVHHGHGGKSKGMPHGCGDHRTYQRFVKIRLGGGVNKLRVVPASEPGPITPGAALLQKAAAPVPWRESAPYGVPARGPGRRVIPD